MGNKTLLFVEDNIVAAEALKSFLKNRYGQLRVADNAEDALKMFLDSPSDIVITDIVLPNMSGFELLEKIKQTNPHTIVFIISAHSHSENIEKAKELGADKFLPKPLDLDLLERSINEAMSN